MKICLHNKRGQKNSGQIKIKGVGNCYKCKVDPIKNKRCLRYYPIDIQTFKVIKEVKGARKQTHGRNNDGNQGTS